MRLPERSSVRPRQRGAVALFEVVSADAFEQLDSGGAGEESWARLRHLDHGRRVEMPLLSGRRFPLLHDHKSAGSGLRGREVNHSATGVHARHYGVLRQDAEQLFGFRGIENHQYDREFYLVSHGLLSVYGETMQ